MNKLRPQNKDHGDGRLFVSSCCETTVNYALCYVKMYNQQKSFVLEAYPIRKEMRKLYMFFLYKSFFILIIICFAFPF